MSSKPFEFEKHLGELEAITAWFDSADADLDQGIVKFERGMELAQQLRSHLADIEIRVEKIRHKFTPNSTAHTITQPDAGESESNSDQPNIFGA